MRYLNFIYAAFIMIIFDIVTGVASAFVTGTFQTSKMREGGKHKLFLLIVISFGISLDYIQSLIDLGFNIPATTTICGYIALMEILSCLENINKAYPNSLPKALTEILYNSAKEKGIESDHEEE